jgi:hypothetical protein
MSAVPQRITTETHQWVVAESNEHLRGGPQGERKKRKHLYHDCDQTGCWDGVRLEHYAAR